MTRSTYQRGLAYFSCLLLVGFSTPTLSDAIASSASHAPIGVMGDHVHHAGEWMVSFRTMRMSMSGNLQGSDSISPEDIVSTVPNTFAGMPGMPPTLRVVPVDMTTDMHMLGVMYAPSDKITLMVMGGYVEKEMSHITFQGGVGTNRLGEFTTKTSGISDTRVGVLIRGWESNHHKIHFNVGLSLPTASIDNTGAILSPMNTRPTVRLPYPMQLGSGTYDFMPGITYSSHASAWWWGAKYMATLRHDENDEGYSLGDEHKVSSWVQYAFRPEVSASVRLTARTLGEISGQDPTIMAPVQTADPSNFGGDFVDLSFGVNLLGIEGSLSGHRLALEYSIPLQQDVNGVQMEMDNMLQLGYQYAF